MRDTSTGRGAVHAFGHALARLHGIAKPPVTVTEVPDSISIDRDVEVSMRDGRVLRVNVFRSTEGAGRPVVLSINPYGKDDLPSRRGKRWTCSFQYRVLRQADLVTFSALTGWEAPDPRGRWGRASRW